MKILLTGANGFVGSHLARVLVEEGTEVHAVVRPGADLSRIGKLKSSLHLIEADLLDKDSVASMLSGTEYDCCVHAAWYAEPGKYLHSNRNVDWVGASVHLAWILAKSGCKRMVGLGTCFEYDLTQGGLSENSPLKPASLYAASKLAAGRGIESLANALDMSFAWARLFYLYGPGEDPRRLVPSVITSLLEGREAKTTRGEQIRDYLHVRDVARALWEIVQSDLQGPVNIGSGQRHSVAEIVAEIAGSIGREDLLKRGALPYREGDPEVVLADNRRLLNETSWWPQYSLREGIRDTVEWWRGRK